MEIYIPNTSFANPQDFGMFGELSGTVNNLVLTGVSVTSTARQGGAWVHVGGIAGVNRGTITNSSVSGNITVRRNISSVGGIAGVNVATIDRSTNNARIWGNGDLGGIAGTNHNTDSARVTNSNNWGRIEYHYNSNNRSVGGIVGLNYRGHVTNNTSGGVVYATTGNNQGRDVAPHVGTVVGFSNRATTSNNTCWSGWGYSMWSNSGNIFQSTHHQNQHSFKIDNRQIGRRAT